MRRRTQFALAFVTVSAAPASAERMNFEIPDPPRLPEVPALDAPPYEGLLVDELPPIEAAKDHHRDAFREPGTIVAVAPNPDVHGTRVRFSIDRRPAKTDTLRLDGVPCPLHVVGRYEAECWTTTAPDAIASSTVELVVPQYDPCHDPNVHGTCNPPPPGWQKPRVNANPPPPEGRVLKQTVTPDGNTLVVSLGTNVGVAPTWRCELPELHLPCTVVRVDRNTTVVTTSANPDQIAAHPRVQLRPP